MKKSESEKYKGKKIKKQAMRRKMAYASRRKNRA